MKVEPHPGSHGVGGAARHPTGASSDHGAGAPAPFTCRPDVVPGPAAMLAALSWQANETIRRQVDMTYALALLARAQAESVAATLERDLPAGPLRDAAAGATRVYMAYAAGLARAATRFGRHFGHLAFAFPPATSPAEVPPGAT
jgi:hypothetical protein